MMFSKTISTAVERDVMKGFAALNKSCQMNNGTACFYLSGMHISGVLKKDKLNSTTTTPAEPADYIIQKDMKKAFEFAARACELSVSSWRSL
jgi:cytochrome c oxidase assembly factor 7